MLVAIDHVIVAVADLDAAAAGLEASLGVEVGEGGRHPLGTRNRLAWWGDSYLELVAIEDERVAAAGWFGAAVAGALVSAQGADAGQGISAAPVGLALASDDLLADAAVTRSAPITDGQRTRPDGRIVRWRMARPGGTAGPHAGGLPGPWPIVFMIEHDRVAAEWTDAERAERAEAVHPLGTPVRLRAVTAGVSSVTGVVGRLGREFALLFRPALVGGGARDASLGRQTLRIAPARPGEPRLTIDLQGGRVARELDVLGCRWRFSPG
ncbi:MAG TPA: VOC family protein [Candidatus Baltobacteraceae bacterium]|nr:VOC family protein [Candidatus Baltobacteraceae bacterium]